MKSVAKITSTQKILLTGATGLLGSQLLKLFVSKKNLKIVLLIRGRNLQACEYRYRKLFDGVLKGKRVLAKVKVISGDITKKYFGLDKNTYDRLCDSINEIFHCAALAEFRQPLSKVRLHNVIGTKNVLEFAARCSDIKKLNYISTVFIAGTFRGKFREKDLDVNQGFNSAYEKSKFEAETLIKKYLNKRFNIAIYRPSIIVGEYRSGRTTNFRMFYQPFRSLSLNLIKEMPINRKTVLNIVPCDYAAKAILLLSQNFSNNDTYHIVSPQNLSILRLMKFASKYIGYKEPKYTDIKNLNLNKLATFGRKLLERYIPYLNFAAVFDSRNTFNKLKKLGFKYPSIDNKFLSRLFEYSINKRFISQRKNNDKS